MDPGTKFIMVPGTKFMLANDKRIYELVGYTSTGEHIVFVTAGSRCKYGIENGYDVTEAKDALPIRS